MRNPFAKAARVAPEDVAEPRPMKNVVDELPAGSDTIAKRPSMAQDESKILTGKKLYSAFTAMLLTLFLVAIDQTILGPALPVITSVFNAYDKAAWIVSSFIFTQACFLLVFGQVLMIFPRKNVYLFAIFIFELGSLLCGVPKNVDLLIFGRALAGVGASGIFVSMIALIADISRLEDRPLLMASFGAVFGISSIVGPLLGGAFTQHVSWRWVFYINLPIGAIAAVAVFFLIPYIPVAPITPAVSETASKRFKLVTFGRTPKEGSLIHRLFIFDFLGAALLLCAIVFLLLAVISGGVDRPWSSGYVIGFLVASGVTAVIFALFEWKLAGACPVLPLRFFKNTTVVGASIIGFCQFWSMFIFIYFLSQSFEAVFNDTPTNAGLKTLPFMASFIISSIFVGILVKKRGRYWPFMVVAPLFLCVGSGLFYTIKPGDHYAKYAGFMVIAGLGIGPVFQNVFLAVQANVKPYEIPQATATCSLFQRLGGAVGYAAAQSVVNTQFRKNIQRLAPTANYDRLSKSIVDIWNTEITPDAIRPSVVQAFAEAVRYSYIIAVPLGGICIIACALLIKNVDIRKVGKPAAPTEDPEKRQLKKTESNSSLSHEKEKAGLPDAKAGQL